MTALHKVKVEVENGYMSEDLLYNRVRQNQYDILHFASHSDEEYLYLNGDKLTPDDIWQIVQIARAKLVFFNSCRSGRLASILVSCGTEFAIYSNIDLPDDEAWQTILAFYNALDNQIKEGGNYSIPKAFNDAVARNGYYGLAIRYDRAGMLPVQRRVDRLEKMVLVMLALGAVHLAVTASFLAAWWNGS